ncbi:MAG: phosphate ABC transporter substrate-binding protein [Deltaproteobacteria bacterium HGW-Deltaproteobacteria-19]|jgi:phosphate transport system substrate-binding protein|nr:MAG: phosphate ABC transporter substrate-binding protein [Deltaproteobacteria bacterium HGW-Deltaproteobacteria-19]
MNIWKKAILALLCCMVTVAPAIAAESIVIKGSTTVLPIAQGALEGYMKANKGVQISLSGGGSGEGIKAIIDNTADIGNSSREIKKEEIAFAGKKGIKPVAHVVAFDALVPVVHNSNPVKDLSTEQLSLIYQGKITNWKEVGGKDMKIVVISRDSSSGTFESWDHFVMKKAKVSPRAQMLASNGAVYTAVSKNRYSIGYLGMGYVKKGVKAVNVGGVQATPETALSRQYPMSRELYMYTNGEPRGETAKFLAFVKSPAGQKIVATNGFVPLKADVPATKGKKK